MDLLYYFVYERYIIIIIIIPIWYIDTEIFYSGNLWTKFKTLTNTRGWNDPLLGHFACPILSIYQQWLTLVFWWTVIDSCYVLYERHFTWYLVSQAMKNDNVYIL